MDVNENIELERDSSSDDSGEDVESISDSGINYGDLKDNVLLKFCFLTDIDHWLQTTVSLGNDFSPFPSKIFALMYFLQHSPKPMVIFHT